MSHCDPVARQVFFPQDKQRRLTLPNDIIGNIVLLDKMCSDVRIPYLCFDMSEVKLVSLHFRSSACSVHNVYAYYVILFMYKFTYDYQRVPI